MSQKTYEHLKEETQECKDDLKDLKAQLAEKDKEIEELKKVIAGPSKGVNQ